MCICKYENAKKYVGGHMHSSLWQCQCWRLIHGARISWVVGHQAFWCGREGYIYGSGTFMEMNSQYLTVCFLYSWQVNRIATERWKWHIWALRSLLFKVPNRKVSIAKLGMQKFKHVLLKGFHYRLAQRFEKNVKCSSRSVWVR